MNISKHSMVAPNEILSDASAYCGEKDFKTISRGFFLSLLQRATQELAFDTFFDERTEFFDVPENLRLDMPKGAFNIRQIYLFNGDECGNISNSQNVYWKRNYYTEGNGYLARDKVTNHRDPFYENRSFGTESEIHNPSLRRTGRLTSIRQTYFYNIQAGLIMLSSTCKAYDKIALVFNGVGADIGDVPYIPMLFREAITSWVIDNALQVKLADLDGADFNKWQTLWSINNAKLMKPYDGLWETAQYRAKCMDSKEREDIKEYIGRLDY